MKSFFHTVRYMKPIECIMLSHSIRKRELYVVWDGRETSDWPESCVWLAYAQTGRWQRFDTKTGKTYGICNNN